MANETKYNWTPIILLGGVAVVMILIGVAVRWLESRFDETVALIAVAAVGGATLFVVGARFGRGAVTDGAKLASGVASTTGYVVVDTVTGLHKSQVEAAKTLGSTVKADNTIRVLDARQEHAEAAQLSRAAIQAFQEAHRAGQLAAGDWDRALTDDDGQGAQSQSGAVYYD